MIELKNVSKRFGQTQALAGVNLRLAPERTTVLIGPSGCGKSTLLRLMIGLVHPDDGTVHVGGERLRPGNTRALRHRMGYVIQEGGLFPHLTGRENVTLLARHLGWPEARCSERIRVLTALAQLPEDRLDAYPEQLSGGERQRVSLLRALMLEPDVLLLDEPLGSLDPLIRAGLQEDLRRIFRRLGKTVVLVTHDLAEAGYFGDTIVLLRQGRIVQQDTLERLVNAPADRFVEDFIRAQRHPLESLQIGDRG